ncbi:MAG: SH3 domain-containing protein [Eubacteriales bacterium]|nr:SH3 domain-containing protein [Eubacteriales bacterium]
MISSKKMKFAVTTAAATAIVCTGAFAANVTATTSVNVRSGPGNSYSVVTVMKSGTTTASLGTSGNWVKVTVNGKTGYVYNRYLTDADGSSSSSTTTTTSTSNVSKVVYVVNTSALNVRSGPSTSHSVIGGLSGGASANVVGSSGKWYKISYGGGYGYISSSYTSSAPSTTTNTSNVTNVSNTSGKTYYSTTAGLNVRSGPGTSYASKGTLSYGQAVTVIDTSSYWYKVQFNGGTGYVGSKYLSSSKPSSSNTTNNSSTNNTPSYDSGSGSSIVSFAQSLLGRPYVYGASGPNSFDCSGFTQYVYAHFGKSLPRSSSAQYASASKISKSSLQPGDLVFFSNSSSGGSVGHVAIYMGNGMIIHAANSKTGVCTTSLNSSYYSSHYIGAGRY